MNGFIPSQLGLLTDLTEHLCAWPWAAPAPPPHTSLLLHLRGIQEQLMATCMHWQVVESQQHEWLHPD